MADQNVTAGIRGVPALADKENELRRVKETLSREQREKSAAEAKLAAAEARIQGMKAASAVRSESMSRGLVPIPGTASDQSWIVQAQQREMVEQVRAANRARMAARQGAAMASMGQALPSGAPIAMGGSGGSTYTAPGGVAVDPERVAMAQANVQAAAQAQAARQAMYDKMAAGGWGSQNKELEQQSADGLKSLSSAIVPMAAVVAGAGIALKGFTVAVEQATAAENARRARSMSANEALGMVGALPPELEKIISSGAGAEGGLGAISPDDARAIAAQYGTSLEQLGIAATSIPQEQRANAVGGYIEQRRRGTSMAGIRAAIGVKGAPFYSASDTMSLAGVPTQTGKGISEVQDAAKQAYRVSTAEDERTTFRDAAFHAEQFIEIQRKSGNILADVPGATNSATAFNLMKSSSVVNIGKDIPRSPDTSGQYGTGPLGLVANILSGIFSNTSPSTKVPNPIEGR